MSLNEGPCLHLHHDMLVEWCYDLRRRLEHIRISKPAPEEKLREALIQIPPRSKWPQTAELAPLLETGATYNRARAARDRARVAYNRAWEAYNRVAWAAYNEARAAHDVAWAAYNEARAAHDRAQVAYDKAQAAYFASFDVDAWHRKVCHLNCPWDGKTIFARGHGRKRATPEDRDFPHRAQMGPARARGRVGAELRRS